MLEKHQKMFELVDWLNEHHNPDNEENPEELAVNCPFNFETDGVEAAITIKFETGIDTVNNLCETKAELLEEFRHALQHFLPAIRSALWAVNKGLEENI